MASCIFVDRPKECSICADTGKLQCLLNHRHLKVSAEGASELRFLLDMLISGSERYKKVSRQEGRHP